MTALLWLIALLASLFSLTYLISASVAAFRQRAFLEALLPLGALFVLLIVTFSVKLPLVTIALAAAFWWSAVKQLRRHTRNAVHARRTATLSATHIALLTGTVLFMLPFAWLISTSLKSDDEQAVFPPVWIPTQQTVLPGVVNADGKPAKLSKLADGTVVAEREELPSGEIAVQPVVGGTVDTSVTPRPTRRAELTKIRRVAPRWENYVEALAYLPPDTFYGLTFLGNTLFLTAMSVIGTLFSSSLVAYSFSRLRWPGKNILFGVLLATMMVPGAVTLMPQFLIFRGLGWVDTLKPLWVPTFFGAAFNIFLLRQFFMSIPTELEDAAKIDGCGPFATYWRVMLPQVKPALAAIAIMTVLGAWNNFQGPLIYLSSPERMPLAYGLQLYQQQHSGEPGLLMAASTLVVLPIIVLFFFTQRYFIEGVSLTGLGGR
jgi:multiple sugar transport system permease protein